MSDESSKESPYTVQRMQQEHTQGVVHCFLDVYGDSYPTKFVYNAEKLQELNESGKLISIVAVLQETGEVVGHCSAERCYPGGAAESGLALVKRSHEGHFLLAQMGHCLDREVVKAGVNCLVSHGVTSHKASQVTSRRAGYKDCCLALGAMPSSLEFKKGTGAVSQRESCVVSMKYINQPAPSVVCIPTHHQEMIQKIYDNLGKPVSFEPLPTSKERGSINVRINNAWKMGDILVQRIGTDTKSEIRRVFRELKATGEVLVAFLELPLDQGGAEDVCRVAEKEGFFFAGLGPNTNLGGESLYLQYLDSALDMSLIQISSPMGKKILEYVATEQERVAGAKN